MIAVVKIRISKVSKRIKRVICKRTSVGLSADFSVETLQVIRE